MSQKKQGKYRFNEFEVDLAARSLRRDGHAVAVSTRTYDLLAYFVLNPQRLVTQSELIATLWPNASVEESNLNQHVFLLRRALSGAQSGDKLVLTFPGRGYQFTASVMQVFEPPPEMPVARDLDAQVQDQVQNQVQDSGLDPVRDPVLHDGQDRAIVRLRAGRRARVSVDVLEEEADPGGSRAGVSGEGKAVLESDQDFERKSGWDRSGPDLESESGREDDADSDEEKPQRSISGGWLTAMLMVALLLIGLGGWAGWRWQHRLRPDSIGLVIVDFYNSTGNALFNESIRGAVRLDLEQSPFLRIAGEQEVREALSRANASTGTRGAAALPLNRDVCLRLGDQAYLTGEIHPLSHKFMVTLQAFDCASGKSLAESRGIADSPDAVLPILDKVAADLREQLGESSASVARFRKPLFVGHAGSLDAFKTYADASELQLEGKAADAVLLLRRAVELDPQFTNAYAELGVLEYKLGDREMAQSTLTKAYGQRDTVSDSSRIFITAAYNDLVTGDLEASIRNEKEGMALYPRNAVFASNLASFELQIGKPAMALEPGRRSIELNPENAATYVYLARAELHLGQFEQAEETCQKAIARHRDGVEIHGILMQIGYLRLDQPAIDEQLAWARGIQDPDAEAYMQLQQGLIAFAEGKTKAGLTIFTGLIEGYRKQGQNEAASRVQSRVPRMEAELGLVEGAHALLNRLPEGIAVDSADIPVAWAEVGESSRADAQIERALEAHPTGTLWQQVSGPEVRAAMALSQQKPAEAVEALQAAVPFDLLGFDAPALRGRAYLAAKQPELAEREFHKILDHPGIEPFSYNYPLAQLGLARSLAQQGKTGDAQLAYKLLFSIWKEADSDLPRLRAAKDEYARLGSAPGKSKPVVAARAANKPSAIRR